MISELVLLAMIAVIAVQLFAHWRLRGSKNGPTSSKDNGEGGGGGDAGLMFGDSCGDAGSGCDGGGDGGGGD